MRSRLKEYMVQAIIDQQLPLGNNMDKRLLKRLMHRIQLNVGLDPPCLDVYQARENVLNLLRLKGASHELEGIILKAVVDLNDDEEDDSSWELLDSSSGSSSIDADSSGDD